jgi:hypothetical protein
MTRLFKILLRHYVLVGGKKNLETGFLGGFQ